jgi:hypothetical protein
MMHVHPALRRLTVFGATAMLALGAATPVATAAAGGDTQDLHGVITIDFPDYERRAMAATSATSRPRSESVAGRAAVTMRARW